MAQRLGRGSAIKERLLQKERQREEEERERQRLGKFKHVKSTSSFKYLASNSCPHFINCCILNNWCLLSKFFLGYKLL